MKWKKSEKGLRYYFGQKYTYAYGKDKHISTLLIKNDPISPQGQISMTLDIKNFDIAKKIVELIELS